MWKDDKKCAIFIGTSFIIDLIDILFVFITLCTLTTHYTKCVGYTNFSYYLLLSIQGFYGIPLCLQDIEIPETGRMLYDVATAMIVYRLIIA